MKCFKDGSIETKTLSLSVDICIYMRMCEFPQCEGCGRQRTLEEGWIDVEKDTAKGPWYVSGRTVYSSGIAAFLARCQRVRGCRNRNSESEAYTSTVACDI